MNRQEKIAAGVAAGAAVAMVMNRAMRERHRIDFKGRHVLITGGSRGLGLVLARQLAAEGARLCLLARDSAELERAQQELRSGWAADVMVIRCDVRRHADVRAAIDTLLQSWDAIDVLINNAGVIQVGPLEHMTREDFENAMATHFWGPLHMMQECIPVMRRRGFGRVVNISSIGGKIAVPHLAPYCASKFALTGLSDAVRAELHQYGIRVTTVNPGLMRTGSPRNANMKGQHESEYAWFAIADALPGVSVAAESAARQIIDACRYGDPDLTISPQARVATWANAIAPSLVAAGMILATRFLPGPSGSEGDRQKQGWESQSRWAPSFVTQLGDRAAVRNNEV
jgi:NAD(P)-dependent dehydrogenase (short-subunit alcohol dehydrogenase family)